MSDSDDFGSLLSSGRYGALKVIRSYLFLTFSKRLDLIALNPFWFRSFTDFGFMSVGVISFLSRNFDAVSDSMPEPVPMSSIFSEDASWELGDWSWEWRYFFRKFAKKCESSAG